VTQKNQHWRTLTDFKW